MTTAPQPGSGSSEGPPVFGALGTELARVLTPLTTVVSVVAAGIAILVAAVWLSDAVIGIAPSVGYAAAIWAFGAGASILIVVTVAIMAILPPLLLRGRDRAATVVHAWLGAREIRRALGRPAKIVGAVGTPKAAARWLERTPPTDALRPIRFEAFLLLGRLEEARAEAELLTRRTPWEEYRYLESIALVEEQLGVPLDEPALRDAIARIPRGEERTEAEGSLAVARARRALPDGDWRQPLVAIRPLIAESDVRVLVRDFGLTTFEVLLRRVGLPLILVIVVLAIVFSLAPPFV